MFQRDRYTTNQIQLCIYKTIAPSLAGHKLLPAVAAVTELLQFHGPPQLLPQRQQPGCSHQCLQRTTGRGVEAPGVFGEVGDPTRVLAVNG